MKLICKREDNYNIDTLTIVKHPKINEIVTVTLTETDQDGTWYHLEGYNEDMFDSNCFRQLTKDEKESLNTCEVLCL